MLNGISYRPEAYPLAIVSEAKRSQPSSVSIVVPNYLHFDVTKTSLEAGFHVICAGFMTNIDSHTGIEHLKPRVMKFRDLVAGSAVPLPVPQRGDRYHARQR